MTSFIQKKIKSTLALPEILREQRELSGFSFEQLAQKIQIATKYLEALEDGLYSRLPGEVYALQFLKKLAKLYRLNETSLKNLYQREKSSQPALLQLPKAPDKNLTSNFFLSPKLIRSSLIVGLVMAVGLYFTWEVSNIFQPPTLAIFSPQAEQITTEPAIQISGRTEPETELLINQQEILTDTEGNFSQSVDLSPGLNIFTVTASKKHSKNNTQVISILRTVSADSNNNEQVTGLLNN